MAQKIERHNAPKVVCRSALCACWQDCLRVRVAMEPMLSSSSAETCPELDVSSDSPQDVAARFVSSTCCDCLKVKSED